MKKIRYEFTEDCLTGIASVDEEHRQLFALINEAFELLQSPTAAVAGAKNLVATLKKYAETHFANEEAYMEKMNDPELPRQRREHQAFAEKVNQTDLDSLDEENGKAVLNDLLEYLARWLYRHILGSDIMIGKIKPVAKEDDPFAFTDKFKTGIESVDAEHRRLFEIVRETNEVIHAELLHDKYDEIMRIIGELKDYTIFHFSSEEAYMESIQYEGLPQQRLAHQAFVDKLNEIDIFDLEDNQQEYLEGLIDFLLGWLVNHILLVDKKIPKR